MSRFQPIFCGLLLVPWSLLSQETHSHSAPEKLGTVSFPISCAPAVQEEFDRGVALLHSFAHSAAESVELPAPLLGCVVESKARLLLLPQHSVHRLLRFGHVGVLK